MCSSERGEEESAVVQEMVEAGYSGRRDIDNLKETAVKICL